MGQGSNSARVLKLIATRMGMWPTLKFIQQGFKGWAYSEGDGIYYSYSVFNDLAFIEKHCSRVLVIPVGRQASTSSRCPLLQAETVLVCAFK
jgi:hypothetical protein